MIRMNESFSLTHDLVNVLELLGACFQAPIFASHTFRHIQRVADSRPQRAKAAP